MSAAPVMAAEVVPVAVVVMPVVLSDGGCGGGRSDSFGGVGVSDLVAKAIVIALYLLGFVVC